MRHRNYFKTLIGVGVLLLTSCDSKEASNLTHTYTEIDKGNEITKEEFKQIASTLKNNYSDYSKLVETFVVEKAEAIGAYSKQMFNELAKSYTEEGISPFDKGYTKTTTSTPDISSTVLGFNKIDMSQIETYYTVSYYNNSNRLSMKLDLNMLTSYGIELSYGVYFDSNGLGERLDMIYNAKFSEDDKCSIIYAYYYDYYK